MKKIQNLKIAAIAALLAALMSPVSSASAATNCTFNGAFTTCSGYNNGVQYNLNGTRTGPHMYQYRQQWRRGGHQLNLQTNCFAGSCTYRGYVR